MDKIKVMLVEDHALVREGTRTLLKQKKDLNVVAEAGDVESAIRLAEVHQPDVILMDIAIPKLNGLEVNRAIKATHPSVAVLVLTAYDDDEYISAFLQAGAAGYLLKDIDIHDLIKAIRNVHAGESVLHPASARRVVLDMAQSTLTLRASEQCENITEHLSQAELDVLRLAARWITNPEIGHELSISARMVQTHLTNVFDKFGVGSRTEALLYKLKKGWLP